MKNLLYILCFASLLWMSCTQGSGIDPQLVQGYWQSLEDAKHQIKIDDSSFKNFYNQKLTTQVQYKFHDNCPKQCQNLPKTACLTIIDKGQEVGCYSISQVDSINLKLHLINGSSTPLSLKKVAPFDASHP